MTDEELDDALDCVQLDPVGLACERAKDAIRVALTAARRERDEARATIERLHATVATTSRNYQSAVAEAEQRGRAAERAACIAAVRLVPLEWLRAAGMQDDASHDRCRAVFVTAIETMPSVGAAGKDGGGE